MMIWTGTIRSAGRAGYPACCPRYVRILRVYGQTNIGGKGGTRIPIAHRDCRDPAGRAIPVSCVRKGRNGKNAYGTGAAC